jgi:RNA polymerase sigma factor (sigma-70 family)
VEQPEDEWGRAVVGEVRRARPTLEDLEHVFRQNHDRLTKVCLSYLNHRADAEDAVQETFIRGASHLTAVNDELEPYLASVARNVCRDMLRRRQSRQRVAGIHHADGAPEEPERVVLDRHDLQLAWQRLSATDRRLFAMRFAGFSYEEMATRAGTSLKAVSVALTRARRRAREMAAPSAHAMFMPATWLRAVERVKSRLSGAGLRSEQLALLSAVSVVMILVAPSATPPAAAAPPASRSATTDGATGTGVAGAPPVIGTGAPHIGGPVAAAIPPGLPPAELPPSGVSLGGVTGLSPGARDLSLYSFAASPGYGGNRTVYAAGVAGACAAACDVLTTSTDGGRTWTTLPALGFHSTQIMAFPGAAGGADVLVGFSGDLGVQVSRDGGATFPTNLPGRAALAGMVAADTGQLRLVTVAATGNALLVYDGGSSTPRLGPTLPQDLTPDDLVFATGGDRVLVSGVSSAPTQVTTGQAEVLGCGLGDSACRLVAAMPQDLHLQLSRTTGSAGATTFLAYSLTHVYLGSAGGTDWRMLPSRWTGQQIAAAAAMPTAGAPTLLVGSQLASGAASVLQSADGGNSFRPVGGRALNSNVVLQALAYLPDGRILASLGSSMGVLCSVDDGVTWWRGC